jgi:hypothetical protein
LPSGPTTLNEAWSDAGQVSNAVGTQLRLAYASEVPGS